MNSRQRLDRCFRHQETDRPGVVVRFFGSRDDPSYQPLLELAKTKADWIDCWDATPLIRRPPTTNLARDVGHWPPQDMADAERFLARPPPDVGGDCAGFFALDRRVGDGGITLVHIGENPGVDGVRPLLVIIVAV